MAHWKVNCDFVFAVIELFFGIYYGCPLMRLNVYSLAVFAWGRRICTQIFTWTGSFPSIILGIRKLVTLHGLPDGEDHIPLCSLVLTQYRRVTDGRTFCRSIYSAVKYVLITSLPKVIWEEGRVAALSHTYAVKSSMVTMARPKFAPKNTSSRGPIHKPHYLPHPGTRTTYDAKRHSDPILRFATMHWTDRRTHARTYEPTDRQIVHGKVWRL